MRPRWRWASGRSIRRGEAGKPSGAGPLRRAVTMSQGCLPCPLCGSGAEHLLDATVCGRARSYYRCPECLLIHVPRAQHVDAASERAVYDEHDNAVDDPGYRRFLSRVLEPLLAEAAPPGRALDFGCGPGPALAAMLEEAGFETALYDPFYYPDPAPLAETYDIVTATEVLEHLADPAADLARLWGCVRPGGRLGVMTKRQPEPGVFARWHYLHDPTHVAFYHDETFRWLAARWDAELEMPRGDVALLRKRA